MSMQGEEGNGGELNRYQQVLKPSALWSLGSVVLALLGWMLVAWLVEAVRGVSFPTPYECLLNLWELLGGGNFLGHSIYRHLSVSFLRWGQGFGIGVLLGLAYALTAGWWEVLRRLTLPLIEVLQLIPGLAWIPVAILIFGLNNIATIFMIAITTFPAVAISGIMGVRSVDRKYVYAARMCGAGAGRLFLTVFLPGAMAHLISGLRIAMGAAWRVLVAAEMIVGSGDGLGYAIIQSRWTMDYVSAFICIIIIASLGLATERLVLLPLEKMTVRRWGTAHGI